MFEDRMLQEQIEQEMMDEMDLNDDDLYTADYIDYI